MKKQIVAGNQLFKNTEAILLLILALFELSAAWSVSRHAIGLDFYQFWVVGQVLDRPDVTNVYSNKDRSRLGEEYLGRAQHVGNPRQMAVAEKRQTLETYSSPFLYSVFRMFLTGDYETDFQNYRLLMLACLTFSIVILSRLLNHSWVTAFGAIAIFSAWFQPLTSEMRVGNVNSVQLAALAAYLWVVVRMRWRYRDILGGALIGIAVAFKPNFVFIAGFLAVDKILNGRIRQLLLQAAGAAGGGIIAIIIAAASFRSLHCWADWFSTVRLLPNEIITIELGNYAPARIFDEWLGINVMIPLAVIFGGLAVAGVWMRRRDLSHESGLLPASDAFPEAVVLSTGGLLLVLVSRLTWLHYYMFTIPIFLVLLSPSAMRRPAAGSVLLQQLLVTLAFLGLAMSPIFNVGIALTAFKPAVLAVIATVILFMLAVFSRTAPKKQIPSADRPSAPSSALAVDS